MVFVPLRSVLRKGASAKIFIFVEKETHAGATSRHIWEENILRVALQKKRLRVVATQIAIKNA
jgi:hypothetical protein